MKWLSTSTTIIGPPRLARPSCFSYDVPVSCTVTAVVSSGPSVGHAGSAASSGIPWWPVARTPSRETARFDRERICAAALRILDEEGYEALSMRRLAAALDAGTMTLYWHVATKDELLALVVAVVMSQVALPDPDRDWISRLRDLAWNTRRALGAHPEVARLVVQGVMAGPALLRLQETTLAILRRAGFDEPTAIEAFYAIGLVFTGSL